VSRVLLDSNLIIYSLEGSDTVARPFIRRNVVACSAISRVETLGFPRVTPDEIAEIRQFFSLCRMLAVDDAVLEGAIDLRQRRKMTLGDSIIAATAIAHGLALATRNVDDFAWIDELSVVNPYAGA
jgi:predicted nucleic acid-binding protein